MNTSDELSPGIDYEQVDTRRAASKLQDKFQTVTDNFNRVGGHSGPGRYRDSEEGEIAEDDIRSQGMAPTPQQQARRHAETLIKEAEASKARILDVPGKQPQISLDFQFIHSALVDSDYQLVAAHVDATTRRKIENCEYVDFAKLIPRHRSGEDSEEAARMQLANHNGRAYYVPVSELEKTQITSLFRWEQAFRVFCDIFTRKYPSKSAELIQYNHTIHTATTSVPWENVAAYDRDFRRHMARHPMRSWAIILQQAWTLHIKENTKFSRDSSTPNQKSTPSRKRDLCWRFNRGKCSYGLNCKFDHRCGVCGKFGHGAPTCRKLGMDRGPDKRDRNQMSDKGINHRYHFYASDRRPNMGHKRENKLEKN